MTARPLTAEKPLVRRYLNHLPQSSWTVSKLVIFLSMPSVLITSLRPSPRHRGRLMSPAVRSRRSSSTSQPVQDTGGFVPAHRQSAVGLNYASFLAADLASFARSDAAHKRASAKIAKHYEQHLAAFDDRVAIAAKAADMWRSAEGSLGTTLATLLQANGGPSRAAPVLSAAAVDVFMALMRRIRLRRSGVVSFLVLLLAWISLVCFVEIQ